MHKGDIVLIIFPFTDLSGNKLRPAVVLHESQNDLIVCFITTQMKHKLATDLELVPDAINGLKKKSLIRTDKIATLEKPLAKGLLGHLSQGRINDLNVALKAVFQIS